MCTNRRLYDSPVLEIMAKYIDEFTSELTLQDLLKSESETAIKAEAIARTKMPELNSN